VKDGNCMIKSKQERTIRSFLRADECQDLVACATGKTRVPTYEFEEQFLRIVRDFEVVITFYWLPQDRLTCSLAK
jgi:hypothetical protein